MIDGSLHAALFRLLVPHAHFALILFGALALGSFILGLFRRNLLDRQSSLDSLRDIPWKHFEFLVAEAFRRQGYQVDFSLGGGADGGVDLVLRRNGRDGPHSKAMNAIATKKEEEL